MEGVAWNFGSFTLISERRLLMSQGLPVRLGGRALDILIALVEYAGQFVGRDELIARIWGGRVVEEINLRVQVAALRRVLGDDERGDPQFIVNLPAKGYCFVAPVTRARDLPTSTLAPRAGADLPASLATLVGRETTVLELGDDLRTGRFVTIAGPGGIGKSAVALKVAQAARSRYPHGVHCIELSGLVDSGVVAARIAEALNVAVGDALSVDWIVEALRDRQVLLILDGCEGAIDQLAMLAEAVLADVPSTHLLVTSREPLRIPGEQVRRLGPLTTPATDAVHTLESALSFTAVQLFSDRASAASGNFEPSAAGASLMVEMCRRLDGIPLAIELAAHRVEHLGLRGLLEQLDAGFDVLTDERRLDTPLQQSLRASFNWSFAGLTPDEQRILCRLSVFAGSFSLASGSDLACDADAGDAVAELIGELVTKSLVSVETDSNGLRYRLMHCTRAYARTRLRVQGDHASVAQRHAALTLALIESADADRTRLSSSAWLLRHAACLDEVRSALDWLSTRASEDGLLLRLLAASVQLWFQLSAVAEFCRRAEQALGRHAWPMDDPDLVRVKVALGHARLHVSGPDAASQAAFDHALALDEHLSMHRERLMALWGRWLGHGLAGRYVDGLLLAQEYEKLALSSTAGGGIAGDRMMLASLQDMGQHTQARARGERVLAGIVLMPRGGAASRPQLEHEAIARTNFARTLWIQGLPDRSLDMARAAVDIARESMHDLTLCVSLQGHCVVALWTGHRDEASAAALELVALAHRHHLDFWAAWGRFGGDAVRVADGDSIRPQWREPLCGIRQLELMATLDANRLEPEVVMRSESGLSPWCEPEVLRARACQALQLATERGRTQARALFERSLKLARTQGALSWELRVATSMASLSNETGERSSAIELLTVTLGKFTEGFATADVLRGQALLGALRTV